jgi:hypothetical protein
MYKPSITLKESTSHIDGIYISPIIDQTLKPRNEDVTLSPELEQLRPLILSQHEVFINLIKDLGEINLTFTKLIKKKKDSFAQLQNHKKIPRSLCIKCELTTSPSYTSHSRFLHLKEKLQDTVSEFIEQGTSIMTEWSKVNIQLLTIDRCSNILEKALFILDGLSSYHTEVIGNPNWPSTNPHNIKLFLFKLYLHSGFGSADELISYLELPLEDILTLGAKITSNSNSNETATNLLQALQLSDLNLDIAVQRDYVSETLTQFDQIIRTTTLDTWKHYNEKMVQVMAASNLKAKMAALETIKATAATATAITKATENLHETDARNFQDNLRITNLEKNFKRHEQKTNELANTIMNKTKNKNLKRKNSFGSHTMEPMASPLKRLLTNPSTPPHNAW